MVQSFGGMLDTLAGLGFFEGILPFVLTYAVFFFVLRYISGQFLFSEWDDSSNKPDQFAALVSIAFAFFTARFITSNPAYADFFTQYMGRMTVLIVGLIGLLVILGFVGIDLYDDSSVVGGILALLAVAAFTVSGGIPASILPQGQLNQVGGILSWMIDTGVLYLVIIGGLLYWTIRDPDDSSDRNPIFVPFGGGGDDGGSGSDGDS